MSDALLSARDLALVDAVARRVLELLGEERRSRWVSVAELAEILGVSRDTVYRHAEGTLRPSLARVGGADRADQVRRRGGGRRLRFDADKAIALWSARTSSEHSEDLNPPAPAGRSPRRRRRESASEGERLPNGTPVMRVGPRNGGRSSKALGR